VVTPVPFIAVTTTTDVRKRFYPTGTGTLEF